MNNIIDILTENEKSIFRNNEFIVSKILESFTFLITESQYSFKCLEQINYEIKIQFEDDYSNISIFYETPDNFWIKFDVRKKYYEENSERFDRSVFGLIGLEEYSTNLSDGVINNIQNKYSKLKPKILLNLVSRQKYNLKYKLALNFLIEEYAIYVKQNLIAIINFRDKLLVK